MSSVIYAYFLDEWRVRDVAKILEFYTIWSLSGTYMNVLIASEVGIVTGYDSNVCPCEEMSSFLISLTVWEVTPVASLEVMLLCP